MCRRPSYVWPVSRWRCTSGGPSLRDPPQPPGGERPAPPASPAAAAGEPSPPPPPPPPPPRALGGGPRRPPPGRAAGAPPAPAPAPAPPSPPPLGPEVEVAPPRLRSAASGSISAGATGGQEDGVERQSLPKGAGKAGEARLNTRGSDSGGDSMGSPRPGPTVARRRGPPLSPGRPPRQGSSDASAEGRRSLGRGGGERAQVRAEPGSGRGGILLDRAGVMEHRTPSSFSFFFFSARPPAGRTGLFLEGEGKGADSHGRGVVFQPTRTGTGSAFPRQNPLPPR